MEIICTENIYKVYNKGRNEVRALDGVSLSVVQGDFWLSWDAPVPGSRRC